MITLPLSIRYADEPRRPPVAWLVPGADAAGWLAEWTGWELPMADWQIVPIGGVGALAILPAGQSPPRHTIAVPLGRIGRRIYLPTHAELSCAAADGELKALLVEEVALAMLLPGRGILAVTAGQILSISDLLIAPPARQGDWTAAQPGEALNDRLRGVFPALPPSLEDILESGRDDIGSRRPDVNELPPRPTEPGDGIWDKAKRGMGQASAGMAQWFTSLFTGGAGGKPPTSPRSGQPASGAAGGKAGGLVGGWLSSLANWAQQKTSGISKQLEEVRNKEVLRLLHMLQNNPDEGLKYALPFGGGGAYRGQGAAGGSLMPRNVDFNLSGLGGGGLADIWDLPWKYQEELRRRYRELANRELQLGRYRRAAYIFANLLDELDAAAAALQSGGHYREAATLYSERLNRPLAAAQCLEQGGLLLEAVAIFEGLGHDEKVGDLYERLEQRSEAHDAWRRAIERAIVQEENYLDAARIAEHKLRIDEEALAILDRGWMQSRQAAACLSRYFQLLGERSRHDDARAKLAEFRRPGADCQHDVLIAQTLSPLAGTYPDVDFCRRAAEIVRQMAGAHLRSALEGERQRLVAAVRQLTPADALLQRDARRYLAQQTPPPPQRQPSTKVRGLPQPKLIRRFKLPVDVAWKAVVSQGEYFFAAGLAGGTLQLVRGRWTGELQEGHAFGKFVLAESAALCLAADVQRRGPLLVSTSHGKLEGSWRFAASDVFPAPAHGVAAIDGGGNIAAGLCYAHGLGYQLAGLYPCCAFGYGIHSALRLGAIARTIEIGNVPEEVEGFLPTCGRPDLLAVGLGRELHLFSSDSGPEIFELPEPILHLAGSAPYSRLRIAAGLAHGGSFLWAAAGQRISDRPRHFAEDLIAPAVCFTATGLLVALSENGGEIFSTAEGKLLLKSRMPPLGQRPLGILPTDFGHQFAVFLADGGVQVMELG